MPPCQHAVGGRCRALLRGPAEGAHGRIDRRHIEVLTTLDKTLRALPMSRRCSGYVASAPRTPGSRDEYAYVLTSTGRHLRAAAATRTGLDRGHCIIESKNHLQFRDSDPLRRRRYGAQRLLASQPCEPCNIIVLVRMILARTQPVGQRRVSGSATSRCAGAKPSSAAAGARLRQPQRTDYPKCHQHLVCSRILHCASTLKQ